MLDVLGLLGQCFESIDLLLDTRSFPGGLHAGRGVRDSSGERLHTDAAPAIETDLLEHPPLLGGSALHDAERGGGATSRQIQPRAAPHGAVRQRV